MPHNHLKQNRVLSFWFGENASLNPLQNISVWFSKDPAIDDQIRENFEPLLTEAETGAFDDWAKTPDGALAHVILCDQFPRHIYRDLDQAFAYDHLALRSAQIAIDHGFENRYSVVEKCFLYLPFEHSESLEMQNRSVELFRDLHEEAHGDEREFIASAMDYALKHQRIIEKYGRFPHRNEILGRESSRAERQFLRQPGSSF